MKLSLIVAMSHNGCIGLDGKLPWQLRDDLKIFKRVTMGKSIIMGRHTFESIGRTLPGRTNIVLTRTQGYTVADGCGSPLVCGDFAEGVGVASNHGDEAVVIGGRVIYERALKWGVDRMYVSHVDCVVNGDTFFPSIEWGDWEVVSESRHEASQGRNDHAFHAVTYERRTW